MAEPTASPERTKVAFDLYNSIRLDVPDLVSGAPEESARKHFLLFAECLQAVQGRAASVSKIK